MLSEERSFEVPRENFLKTIIFFASSCGPVVSLVLAIMYMGCIAYSKRDR